jgi:cytochrome c oxidase assembly protein subunit 15
MYVIWLAFGLIAERPGDPERASRRPPSRRAVWLFIALLAVQIVWGAFMAGTRAGYLASTFPTMNGEWVPSSFLATDPWYLDLMENPFSVHFLHRTLGWVTLLAGLALWWHAERRAQTPRQRLAARLIGGGTALQFLLGVLTVILYMPLWAAVAHQGGAFLLLTATLLLAHSLRRGRALTPADAPADAPPP